jgi:hypothetical protein
MIKESEKKGLLMISIKFSLCFAVRQAARPIVMLI